MHPASDAADSPDVLIVSYRRADLLATCLQSVATHLPGSRVFVWDNASDGTADIRALAAQMPAVDWHFSDQNVGFAAAVNGLVARSHAPAFVLMNPDAVLCGDLAGCRAALAADDVAAAAPLISEHSDGEPVFGWTNAHREPNLVRQIVSYAGLDARVRFHPALSLTYGERPTEVDGYLTGACLVIDRAAWAAVGAFDERYFLYGEEADWSARARAMGYRLVLVDEPGVIHSAAGTVTDDPAAARASLERLTGAQDRYLTDHHGARAAAGYRAARGVLNRVQRSKRFMRVDPSAPPRLIITSPTLEFGGAERQRVTLANALADRGCDVTLRLMQRSGPLADDVDSRVHIEVASYRTVRRAPAGMTLLVSGTTLVEVAYGLAWRALNLDRGRWVVANHRPALPDQGAFPERPAHIMKRADGMIYLSESHRVDHRRHQRIDRGRYWVIPNGIDLSGLTPDLARIGHHDNTSVRVVSIGRLVEWKQNDILIKALAAAADDPRWQLDIWGDGPDAERLTAMIPDELRSRITMRGWCHDVAGVLADADIFALASRSEAHPMAVLEAMGAGVPVICAPAGSLREVIEDEAGVMVDPPTLEHWTRALCALIDDPEDRRRRAERALARVRERYTVDRNTDEYLTVWRELCLTGEPAPARGQGGGA